MQQPQVQSAPAIAATKTAAAVCRFLIRKLSEVGAMSKDDLRHLAEQEGYFAEAESAKRGVHICPDAGFESRSRAGIAQRQFPLRPLSRTR